MQETITMPVERRRYPRTQLQVTLRSIRLDPDGGDMVDCLHMTNISRAGIGAICDRAFYPGQRVVLNLPVAGSPARRNVYAKVVRCNQQRQAYHVGLEFENFGAGSWATGGGATTIAAA